MISDSNAYASHASVRMMLFFERLEVRNRDELPDQETP